MARAGLTELISLFRRNVQESGTAIFSDDDIETFLDDARVPLVEYPVVFTDEVTVGGTVYSKYRTPNYRNLEGTASGALVARLTDSVETIVTDFTMAPLTGDFTFPIDTNEQTYYYTGYSFDMNEAVANGWYHKASYYSNNFDFQVEGRSFKKSQVVANCLKMAELYGNQATVYQGNIYRSDYR
jgi:hypothetical protein